MGVPVSGNILLPPAFDHRGHATEGLLWTTDGPSALAFYQETMGYLSQTIEVGPTHHPDQHLNLFRCWKMLTQHRQALAFCDSRDRLLS